MRLFNASKSRCSGRRALRSRAVERFIRARKRFQLPSINLPAVAPFFINNRPPQSRFHECVCGAHARCPGADHDHLRVRARGHTCSPAVSRRVTIDMPSVAGVVHPRTRFLSSVHTHQSWYAPIKQNPARRPSSNSESRRASCALRNAKVSRLVFATRTKRAHASTISTVCIRFRSAIE